MSIRSGEEGFLPVQDDGHHPAAARAFDAHLGELFLETILHFLGRFQHLLHFRHVPHRSLPYSLPVSGLRFLDGIDRKDLGLEGVHEVLDRGVLEGGFRPLASSGLSAARGDIVLPFHEPEDASAVPVASEAILSMSPACPCLIVSM